MTAPQPVARVLGKAAWIVPRMLRLAAVALSAGSNPPIAETTFYRLSSMNDERYEAARSSDRR